MTEEQNLVKDDEEYPRVTKDSLIKGHLTLYDVGSISDKVFIMSIKKIAEDNRIMWED